MPHRSNGSYVSNSDALTAWTPIAWEALLETARSYHAVLTDEQLAATVQQRSGIIHDQPAGTWVGKLLDRVAAEAQRRDEPPLAALCIGETDDRVKAARRLQCYRAYADDVPADGGTPEEHRRVVKGPVAARREPKSRATATSRARATPTPALREVTCPNCWMIVAARPTCSSCGASLDG
jgi:hypothetical protein